MSLAMFTLEDDLLVPTEVARSMWSHDQMHGVAISGALARGLEQRIADAGPHRSAARAIHRRSVQARQDGALHRDDRGGPGGRRICLIDATLLQDGVRVARASCIFVLPTESPRGRSVDPR